MSDGICYGSPRNLFPFVYGARKQSCYQSEQTARSRILFMLWWYPERHWECIKTKSSKDIIFVRPFESPSYMKFGTNAQQRFVINYTRHQQPVSGCIFTGYVPLLTHVLEPRRASTWVALRLHVQKQMLLMLHSWCHRLHVSAPTSGRPRRPAVLSVHF